MVNLRRTVEMLQATRNELVKELDAVDRAIAALSEAEGGIAGADEEKTDAVEPAPRDLVATTVKPKRVMSDAHRQAIIAGRRKGREAKEVAAGRAREMPAEGFVAAIATGKGSDAPRLVKRPRELVAAPVRR